MSIVNLLSVMVVLFTSGALLASGVALATQRFSLARLASYAPAVRVRWLAFLAASPTLAGGAAVLVAFGPCLRTLVLRLPDGCHDHGGPDFFFCLREVMRAVPLAWLVASAVLGLGAWRFVVTAFSLARARRALGALRRVGTWDASRRLWLVPGALAIVAGFPRAEIFLGEELAERVGEGTLDAVLAHERAHMRRGDLRTKVLARFLSSTILFRGLRERLLAELDLAIEQACDAVAANEVQDPLLVARSLVDLARVAPATGEWSFAFASPSSLEARLRALCEPQWRSSRDACAAVLVVVVMGFALCAIYDPKLHDYTEALFGSLLGG